MKWREIREVDLICQFHPEINATDTNKLTPNLGKYASKRRLIGVMVYPRVELSNENDGSVADETSKNFQKFWEFQKRFIIKILKIQCKIGS